jgi:hypothetical protein
MLGGTRSRVAYATALATIAIAIAVLFGAPRSDAADPVVSYGSSDAQSVAVLSGLPGYKNEFWWDHSNLTVSVRAGESVDPDKLQALRDAIQIWRTTLADEFHGAISMTDVTAEKKASPDIVLRYVPHAGGTQWGGVADCGVQKCLNVIVRSDTPDGHSDEPDRADFDRLRVERTAVHELGHTLGLGHASPLLNTVDLMGYGWSVPDPDVTPVLSSCDLRGIRAAFGWVFAHEAPHPSTVGSITC